MKNGPILLIVGFSLFTLLLFYVGPLDWNAPNQLEVAMVVVFSQCALLFGYFFNGDKSFKHPVVRINTSKLIWYGSILNVLTLPVAIYVYTGGSITNVSFGLSSQGDVHRQFYEHVTSFQGGGLRSVVAIWRALIAPVVVCSIILGIKYWPQIKTRYRFLVGATIFSQILFSFARGTDKELADLLTYFVAVSLLAMRYSMLKNILKYGLIAMVCLAMLNVFIERRESRYYGEIPSCFSVYRVCADVNNSTFAKVTGASNYLGLAAATNYMTQGYNGLALAIDLPHEWTFGLGHAPAVSRTLDAILGTSVSENTYSSRLDAKGWDRRFSWSSLYTWLANDLTFFLVPGFFFALGVFFSRAYNEATGRRCDVSTIIYCYLFLGMIYGSTNNQLGVSMDMAFGFYFWLFWWLFRRRKYG